MPIEHKIASFIVNRRWLVLAIVLAGTVFLGYQWRHFRIDHVLLDQLQPDDPERLALSDFEETFGQYDLLVATLETPDVFTPPLLEEIARVTEALEEIDEVESVVSLATLAELEAEDGSAGARPVLEEFLEENITLEALRETVLQNPVWVGNVVSADGTTTAINIFIDQQERGGEARKRILGAVRGVLDTISNPEVTVRLTGQKAVVADAVAYVSRDTANYLWLTPIFMGVLLFLLFRRKTAVVAPLVLIGLVIVWTMGAFFLAGNSLGLATTLLPTLVGLITLSDVIHALCHYYSGAFPEATTKKERIILTMEHMIDACFMTSITTAAGLGSLMVSSIKSIHEFGYWASIGILLSYGLVMTILPILLSFLPVSQIKGRVESYPDYGSRIDRWVVRRKKAVWIGTGVVLAVCGYFAFQVTIEAQIADSLPESAPSIEAMQVVDDKLAGTVNLEIRLGGEEYTFEEIWAIREVDRLQQFLAGLPKVSQVISPASIIRQAHDALGDGAPTKDGLPEESADVADYFFLLSSSAWHRQLSAFITENYADARVSMRVKNMSTSEILDTLEAIDEYAAANLDPRLTITTTGRLKLFAAHISTLVKSLLGSLALSIGLIGIILAIYFRSIRVALVSLLPNIIPVLVPLAIMGIWDIPLSAGTVMVSCLAVGLAVGNAIHFIATYRRKLASGMSMEEALRWTLTTTGRAIVIVSIVIAGGFTIFLLSSFPPNRHFGILVAVAILCAPIVDLLLLPLLIRLFAVK